MEVIETWLTALGVVAGGVIVVSSALALAFPSMPSKDDAPDDVDEQPVTGSGVFFLLFFVAIQVGLVVMSLAEAFRAASLAVLLPVLVLAVVEPQDAWRLSWAPSRKVSSPCT
eukprot:CAMPEP_0197421638 /NCGR_PEP_ID=MMETSP1170-20131217/9904_1 /TAXON_ID=54406 /ORGANISM="Sarcinochrysis sp, Strain CCMP770" /LENGTH=112 /DNA_ID=CAMNT_0042948903 /DNA_START=15 /DNA_END=353 /DNA_ORIENTATION=+